VQDAAVLVEEVARVQSLSLLEGKPLARSAGVARPVLTAGQKRERVLRRTLAALGMNECVTYSFVDHGIAALFGGGADNVAVANPISSDLSHMRPDILPGLLQAAARNQARGFGDIAMFEIGPIWSGGEPEDQARQAGGLRVGHTAPRDTHGSRRTVDVFDAKADAEAALAAIGAPDRLMVLRTAPDWFHPGRSGVLSLGPKTPLAAFGEVHPKVLAELDIKGPAVAFTLWPDAVPMPRRSGPARAALKLTDLQAVERDFAFVVDRDIAADVLIRAAQGANKALIEKVTVFDEFSGERAEAQMGPGKKSIAISVCLQPREATLTEKEIDAVSSNIIAAVTKATGGLLRG